MPTRGRPEYAAAAVASFLAQDFDARELVILDDGDCPSFANGIDHALIRYHRIDATKRFLIPAKRNQVNELAKGEWIAHFDSDDWSSPRRLSFQMQEIERAAKKVCGFGSILFWEEEKRRVFKYKGRPNYAVGSSFFYRRDWWARNPFRESQPIASDNPFVYAARDAKELLTLEGENYMVARIHQGNTSPKRTTSAEWKELSPESLPSGFMS